MKGMPVYVSWEETFVWREMEWTVELWFIRVCCKVTPGEVAPPM